MTGTNQTKPKVAFTLYLEYRVTVRIHYYSNFHWWIFIYVICFTEYFVCELTFWGLVS